MTINASIPLVRGRTLELSLPRRFVCDLMHFSKQVPGVPMERTMRLGDVMKARAAWPEHVSWCAIFMKAYAIVAANWPELRRSYLPFPWPRLYEHPENVASFSVERLYRGENGVFCGRISRPESLPLTTLDKVVRAYKTEEIDKVDSFQQALSLSRLPRPLRRAVWWAGLYLDGMYRSHFFGTFGISVVASLGAAGLHLLSPLTTVLNYGTFGAGGQIDVRVTYDHRVLDGATLARAMVTLEDVLHNDILDELTAGPAAEQSPLPTSVLTAASTTQAYCPVTT